MRGGDSLRCDACELDAAVIELAREYLCLGACETTGGGARISVADGAEVLASAADASYALVVCDLDMGTLLRDAAAAQPTAAESAEPAVSGGGPAPSKASSV